MPRYAVALEPQKLVARWKLGRLLARVQMRGHWRSDEPSEGRATAASTRPL